jgi:NDP-sugar pyrophosphorylase family protein
MERDLLRGNGRPDRTRPVRAVVLAGGRGTRLAPYTSVLPKPLMPIGNRAILEIVLDQLAGHGFNEVTLCVGHLAHLIRAVLDSRNWRSGGSIEYVQEEEPLGTAGPLRRIGRDESLLVMNGDVLTTLDFSELVQHHVRSENALTIATHQRTIKIDYGVIYVSGSNGSTMIDTFEEKPEIVSTVSMGVYVLEPTAIRHIPDDRYFDIPDLIHALLAAGEPVGAYTHEGMWFDIGRQDDYAEAANAWVELESLSEANQNG